MATYYWVGGNGTWDNANTANWSNASGGATGFGPPLAADTAIFDSASGTGTCTTTSTARVFQVTLNTSTLELKLGANLSGINTFTYTLGVLSLQSYTLSCFLIVSSNANVRTLNFGTGNVTLIGNNTTIWNAGNMTNFSYTGTPTVNCTYSGSSGTRTISAGSTGGTESNALNFNISAGTDIVSFIGVANKNVDFTGFSGTCSATVRFFYGNVIGSSGMTWGSGTGTTTFAATSGTQQITTAGKPWGFPIAFNGIGGTFSFQDTLTQGSTRAMTLTNGTVQFRTGTTNTVGSFATSGTNQKYLQSTTAGSQAILFDASGTNSLSYTTIQDIFATGGATWNAYYANGNIDGGNNTNWNFGGTPSYNAEYGYKLRSFTEQGRF